jgi:hypothetical protein
MRKSVRICTLSLAIKRNNMLIPNIEEIRGEVSTIIKGTPAITTPAAYLAAADYIKILASKLKALEEKRKAWTRPMLEAKKKIDADFNEVEEVLQAEIDAAKSAMVVWQHAEQKRLDARQIEIEAEATAEMKATGALEVSVPVVNDIKTQRGRIATATLKKIWTFQITDEAAVPEEYKSIDEAKIKEAIRAGAREIAGVRIFQSDNISIR